MDAALSDEQVMLAELADSIGERFGFSSPFDPSSRDASRAWRALDEAGLLSLVDEAEAPGLHCVEAAIVVQALARRLCAVPYLGQAALAPALLRAAGVTAPQGRRCAVAFDYALGQVSGAELVFDSQDADCALVLNSDCGLEIRPLGDLVSCEDITRSLHAVSGEGAERLAESVDPDSSKRWTAFGLAVVSADMLGVVEGALDAAVEYATNREQYGQPIGSFQAIQHLLADQAVCVEAARAAVYHAAWAVDSAAVPDALLAAHTTKAYLARIAPQVTEAVLQVFGGMGMTWEAVPHVYLRRALFDAVFLGDERSQLSAIAAARAGSADAIR